MTTFPTVEDFTATLAAWQRGDDVEGHARDLVTMIQTRPAFLRCLDDLPYRTFTEIVQAKDPLWGLSHTDPDLAESLDRLRREDLDRSPFPIDRETFDGFAKRCLREGLTHYDDVRWAWDCLDETEFAEAGEEQEDDEA